METATPIVTLQTGETSNFQARNFQAMVKFSTA